MIIVKIERWPDHVDPDDPQEERRTHTDIARAVIRNDHSGTNDVGNYVVRLYDPPPYNPWVGITLEAEIKEFPRKQFGAWDLVYRALRTVIGDRNESTEPAERADDSGRALEAG